MDRRAFLAATGAVLGAGCSALPGGSSPTPTATESPTPTPTPRPTPTPQPFRRAQNPGFTPGENPFSGDYSRSGGLELGRGEFVTFGFDADRDIQLDYAIDVIDGGPVDVLAMSGNALERYQSGDSGFAFYANRSSSARSKEVSVRLPAGSHALAFDNTHLGPTDPQGSVRFVFGMNLSFPSG